MTQTLDAALAERFAHIALGHVRQEYPNKIDHVLTCDADARTPRQLHPVFFGSFDWHSCVHGWWLLLTLRRKFPDMAAAERITALAGESFTTKGLAAECGYFDAPSASASERPYGWAWLLYLHLEASRHTDQSWAGRIAPLAHRLGTMLADYLKRMTYPIRTGTHANTAFALALALEWADRFDAVLAETIRVRVAHWCGPDRDCAALGEPGGDEFLSPALVEALCVMRVMPEAQFDVWLSGFFPNLAAGSPDTLFTPATVSDRTDGKIAHLDGLNLSRAWCWQALAPRLSGDVRSIVEETAHAHLAAAMPHLDSHYAGTHWLASFALLALLVQEKD